MQQNLDTGLVGGLRDDEVEWTLHGPRPWPWPTARRAGQVRARPAAMSSLGGHLASLVGILVFLALVLGPCYLEIREGLGWNVPDALHCEDEAFITEGGDAARGAHLGAWVACMRDRGWRCTYRYDVDLPTCGKDGKAAIPTDDKAPVGNE